MFAQFLIQTLGLFVFKEHSSDLSCHKRQLQCDAEHLTHCGNSCFLHAFKPVVTISKWIKARRKHYSKSMNAKKNS